MIATEDDVVKVLKNNYNLDLNGADLVGGVKIFDYMGNILTKNSPWVPIVSLGFRILEEKGIIQNIYFEVKNDFAFTADVDGIPLNKMILLFIFFSALIFVSLIAFGFECLNSKLKGQI